MKIDSGKLEKFKRQAAECIKQVTQNDLGILQYDWFLRSDKTEWEIHETYKSSEAALAHQSDLHETLRTVFEKFGLAHSALIYGDPSPELLEQAKASGLDIKIFSFSARALNQV